MSKPNPLNLKLKQKVYEFLLCPDHSVCILIKTEKFSFSEMLRKEILSVSGLCRMRIMWKYFQLQQKYLYDV